MNFTLLVACLCTTLAAVGAPPPNVAGKQFQHVVFRGSSLFSPTSTQLLLNRDGTYTGLQVSDFIEGNNGRVATSVLTDVSIPKNGTWSYRVLDSATAELVLDGSMVQLRFDEDKPSGRATSRSSGLLPDLFYFDEYDATTRLANCSTLAYVAAGRRAILGFVVTSGTRRVLVRAVGPGLRSFGVIDPLAAPILQVYPASQRFRGPLGLSTISRTTLDAAAQRAGAFPLPSANDTGQFLTLSEGAYTVEVFSLDRTASGEVLVEVYQLP